jgi:phage terminase large subunit
MDEAGCSAGLEAVGWYHEKRDENREIGLGPEHDWASHGADSFGLMCVVYEAVGAASTIAKPIAYKKRFVT